MSQFVGQCKSMPLSGWQIVEVCQWSVIGHFHQSDCYRLHHHCHLLSSLCVKVSHMCVCEWCSYIHWPMSLLLSCLLSTILCLYVIPISFEIHHKWDLPSLNNGIPFFHTISNSVVNIQYLASVCKIVSLSNEYREPHHLYSRLDHAVTNRIIDIV